jgi:putative chitinase
MNLTTQNLLDTKIKPAEVPNVLQAFNSLCDTYKVTSFLRIAHFMAQVCHESNGFRITVENMNYTNPHRLMVVWPRRFPTLEIANQYINNPPKLANFVYANRMGNGNAASGDGFSFRGRGPMQTTGRESYALISKKMFGDGRLLDNPDLLAETTNGLNAAFIEWNDSKCNLPADADDIKVVTKLINGGLTGLDSRKLWLAEWKHTLTNNPA